MLEELKKKVCTANIELFNRGVIIYTWGNVSGIDRAKNLMVIKPSGVAYEILTPEDMVVVDVSSGETVEGNLKPSTDTPTHLELYRAFTEIGGIAHTHSTNAVAFAQAGRNIPALGTTHADYFYGDIPCTRELSKKEIDEGYESNTGKSIVETIKDPQAVPGVLARNHGVFTWGKSAADAVYNAVVLEKIAEMALKTTLLNNQATISKYVLEKHYLRKHGKDAYYGQ